LAKLSKPVPFLLLGAFCLLGQMNTGEIAGSVQDALGGALPGATVVAEQAHTGQKFTTITNGSGQYLLTQLPIGTYSLKINAENFKQSVISNIEVHIGDSLRHDITIQIGDANETVVVEADSGAVQPESAEIKDVIQSRQIVNLPLKTRQFLDLAILSQGVVRPPGGTRGDAMQQAGTLVNVLGQRSGHNLYLIDGATVTDEHFNNMVVAPSIDSISEFNIQKTPMLPSSGASPEPWSMWSRSPGRMSSTAPCSNSFATMFLTRRIFLTRKPRRFLPSARTNSGEAWAVP